jgi:hypothetical protein
MTTETIERCALYRMKYFPNCGTSACNGLNNKRVCYLTSEQLLDHIEEFNRIFEMDNGRLEDQLEGEELF